jgi:hypothetical protein
MIVLYNWMLIMATEYTVRQQDPGTAQRKDICHRPRLTLAISGYLC